jgi:hypothetical protein
MPGARIGGVHGTVHPVDSQTGAENAQTYAMYHPAAALRASSLKQTMLEDMSGLPQVLIDARAKRAGGIASPLQSVAAAAVVTEPVTLDPVAVEPVAVEMELQVEAEQVLAAVAVTADTVPEPVDENQMSLF